jgi:hypothetical protein
MIYYCHNVNFSVEPVSRWSKPISRCLLAGEQSDTLGLLRLNASDVSTPLNNMGVEATAVRCIGLLAVPCPKGTSVGQTRVPLTLFNKLNTHNVNVSVEPVTMVLNPAHVAYWRVITRQ